MLGGEAGNGRKVEGRAFSQGVTDGEIAIARQANDVTCVRFFDHFAIVGKEFVGARQAHRLAGAGVFNADVTLKTAAANA